MKGSPDHAKPLDPASVSGERAAIFGLETEYVILYVPEDPDDDRKPPFSTIQEILFSILLAERKAALSGGIKRGYFLQNGGLIHLEIYLRAQEDTPILEAATPECRSPSDVLVYARAFDRLLRTISRKSAGVLAERGYAGSIAFGKSNRDSRGVGLGSHENYLVYLSSSRTERLLFSLCVPIAFVCLLPALAVFVLILLVAFISLIPAKLVPQLRNTALKAYRWLRAKRTLWQNLVAAYHLGSNALLFPAVWFYTTVLRLLAFRPFIRDLTPFVITRQILTGSGLLNFEKQRYEISQRAGLTRSLSNIVMFGKGKTVYDLKGLLYEPLSFFRPTKKLTITAGDSNLSDIPGLLKFGATALIIEMIEDGETFENLRPRRPLVAFRRVSLEGPWKQLELAAGGTRSAMDIQREYLSRAREYFAGRPEGRVRYGEILELWGKVLELLGDRPQSLTDAVDWVAKKSLLDAAILPRSDWKKFFAWGRAFHLAGIEAAGSAESLADLQRRAPRRARRRLAGAVRRLGLGENDFLAQRELHFQARKIDLRYHDLDASGGYQRKLETDGLIQRLTLDADVERASREPPQDTRARIRGYYIRLSPKPESIHASWNEIELLSPFRHISLADPFFYHLPGDE